MSKDIIKKFETLNEEHIIGCGGFGTVYKLAMDDGNVFALKRIIKLNEGFDRFFERELEILGSIKHRFLVNLRGYCNSPTSKLLIYDFLPGGSLDEALHGKDFCLLLLVNLRGYCDSFCPSPVFFTWLVVEIWIEKDCCSMDKQSLNVILILLLTIIFLLGVLNVLSNSFVLLLHLFFCPFLYLLLLL